MFSSKPLNELKISDILDFLKENQRECEVLDYKENWPNDLAKVIAAMANTQGGYIFIGVSEKDGVSGLPDRPIGVPISKDLDSLRQKVISMTYDLIYSPIKPEVEAYPLEDNPKQAIVVIRVSPSEQTPHAVHKRTKVYVRIDSQSRPHRLADIADLRWLFDRRKKGEKYLADSIKAIRARANLLLQDNEIFNEGKPALLEAWIAPKFYFGKEVLSLEDTNIYLLHYSEKSSLFRLNWSFPGLEERSDGKRSVPMGFCIYASKQFQQECPTSEYSELSTDGILYTRLKISHRINGQNKIVLPIKWILPHLDAMIKFADQRLKNKMWGIVNVRIRISGLSNSVLQGEKTNIENKHTSLDSSVELLDESIDLQDLESNRQLLTKRATRNLLWAFNHPPQLHKAFESWWNGIQGHHPS